VTIPSPASLSHIGIRIAIVAAALGIWFWTQALIGRKKKADEGIGDRIHELTAGWHQSLLVHPRRADALLLLSSFFIDLFGLALIGFAVFGPSLGPLIALMIVFALRQICQSITTLPPPPGIIWRSPGFPSLLVTYGVSNDLFFSGHTTLAVLGAIEVVHLAPAWVGVAAAIIAVFEAVVVVVLRAHYTLDVITGALAAYWASEMARIIAPGIDAWLAALG
jgi:hypothetical protein